MQAGGDNTPRPGKECPGLESTICGAHTGQRIVPVLKSQTEKLMLMWGL